MSASRNDNAAADTIGTWLKRLALVAVIALLACSSWFVWRISMVAQQVESAIVAVSADVKKMSSTGAQISDHLQQLDGRLKRIEDKAADAMNLDELEHLLVEVNSIRDAGPSIAGGPSANAEREIKHLLRQIRDSPHRFVYSDENKGGLRFYIQLYAKYKAYDNILGSAEDFIDKVGTKTIAGQPYRVVISDNETVTLDNWLTEELKQYRSASVKTPNTP
jgi:hypothetical protein